MGPGWSFFVLVSAFQETMSRTRSTVVVKSLLLDLWAVHSIHNLCFKLQTTQVVVLKGAFKPVQTLPAPQMTRWLSNPQDCVYYCILYVQCVYCFELLFRILPWSSSRWITNQCPEADRWERRHWPDARAPRRVPPAHESAGRWSHSSCQFLSVSVSPWEFRRFNRKLHETKNKHVLRCCEVHCLKTHFKTIMLHRHCNSFKLRETLSNIPTVS